MNNILGKNLKRFRLSKDYTQEQAAQLLNISPKSLSRWECGSTMPDVMLLPDIARLYCVTVDDLFREESIAYENYASRLLAVYEATSDINDFFNAEREYSVLIQNGNYTMNDLRSYAILYQYLMMNAKTKSLQLFQKGLDMGLENDPKTYHMIERQRMLLRSQIGENEKSIQEYTSKLADNPLDFYNHINLLVAYLFANDNQNALNVFLEAVKKFEDQALLQTLGGDIYRNLKMYDEAFACWDKTIALDSEMVDALWSKAFCLEELGDYKSAYSVWEEIIAWQECRGYEIEVEEVKKLAQKCKEKIKA
ncbi:MAG: helix-turn-helix domain-containing protein [Lachnospiraceae bacterium]|nr:helix-turn-helix domain-containing protein [Lachnospiraceae bacterium]